jgi:hypothetical protein
MAEKDVEGQPARSLPHWRIIIDQGIVTPEIEQWQYEGKGTQKEPFAVTWIDNDPRNPMTWSETYKWMITVAMALATLTVAFTSSAFSGGMYALGVCTSICLFEWS